MWEFDEINEMISLKNDMNNKDLGEDTVINYRGIYRHNNQRQCLGSFGGGWLGGSRSISNLNYVFDDIKKLLVT